MAETTQNILYKKGSKGEEVGKIQTALGDYYTKFGSTVDNDYGNDTAGGVWDWQTQWNKDNPNDQIKVDGIVGPQTYPRLMKWYADKQAAPTTQTVPAAGQPAADATGTVAETPAGTPVGETAGTGTGGIDPSEYTFTGKQLAQMGPAVEDEPGKPQYLTDWSKVSNVYEEAKNLNLPLAQVLQDYQRWGNETGNPTYWINAMFQDADLSKTAADNEKEKKRIANKERWDKVSNFLLHLGNAIGNVGGGGYASMALEDPVKWGERQRLLKEKGLEQRRLNNQSIYQQMRQGWADQRTHELQKQRLENEKLKVGLQEELAKARKANDELRTQLLQKQIDKLNTMTPLQADTEKSKAEKNRQQGKAAITRANKTGNGGGRGKQDSKTTTTYNRDSDGKVTKSERVTTYGKPASTSGNKGKVSTGVKWRTRK